MTLLALVAAASGWCSHPASPAFHAPDTHFEIDPSTWKTQPHKGSYDGERDGEVRERGWSATFGMLEASIVGNKLRLATQPMYCRDTNSGCRPGEPEIRTPSRLLIEDPVPHGACIDYVLRRDEGIVVGLGSELRVYAMPDTGPVKRVASMKTPQLERVAELTSALTALQDASGQLWLLRWDRAPKLERVAAVAQRTLTLVDRGSEGYDVFTTDGLISLDASWHVRWQLTGQVEAAIHDRHAVALVIEHGDRVVAHELDDATGRDLGAHVIYTGNVLAAQIGYLHGAYLVHLATK